MFKCSYQIEYYIPQLAGKLRPFFEAQRMAYHQSSGTGDDPVRSPIARLWDMVLFLMISWFVKSIIESLVQERLAELDEQKLSNSTSEVIPSRLKLEKHSS